MICIHTLQKIWLDYFGNRNFNKFIKDISWIKAYQCNDFGRIANALKSVRLYTQKRNIWFIVKMKKSSQLKTLQTAGGVSAKYFYRLLNLSECFHTHFSTGTAMKLMNIYFHSRSNNNLWNCWKRRWSERIKSASLKWL